MEVQGAMQVAVQQRERRARQSATGAGDAEAAGQRAQRKFAPDCHAQAAEQGGEHGEASGAVHALSLATKSKRRREAPFAASIQPAISEADRRLPPARPRSSPPGRSRYPAASRGWDAERLRSARPPSAW